MTSRHDHNADLSLDTLRYGKPLRRLLIANRGEIACRIIRTARSLGITSIAIYSEADKDALHVAQADEAYALGGLTSQESYLNIRRIMDQAIRAGADALHPGYGFLSENPALARACNEAGIIFVGPSPAAIEAMGAKDEAKRLMANAGIPLIPGYHGKDQTPAVLLAEAEKLGYPVLVKASAGGGGKGMRVVHRAADFDEALASAQREARSSFGNDHMLIERYVQAPRHIEIQVFMDRQGNGVYLGDRDCSIQRRHQKIIEEAPAPGLSDELRQRMGQAAVNAASAIGYEGAGTVEFLLDASGEFYFMEMNTRLQVEHPVTEFITGQDLVAWQLSIAEGLPLPLTQAEVCIQGHAVEVRIYAEDPAQGFMPSCGRVTFLREPVLSEGVRLDTGIRAGDEVTPYYDPMIAKLIAGGNNRPQAIYRLERALAGFAIGGITTNIGYLQALLEQPDFYRGEVTTDFIATHEAQLDLHRPPSFEEWSIAAWMMSGFAPTKKMASSSPWHQLAHWQLNQPAQTRFSLSCEAASHEEIPFTLEALLTQTDGAIEIALRDQQHILYQGFIHKPCWQDESVSMELDGKRYSYPAHLLSDGEQQQLILFSGRTPLHFSRENRVRPVMSEAEVQGALHAPMNSTVVDILVSEGQQVEAQTALVIVEAMKMEHVIRSPSAGMVSAIRCAQGDRVSEGQALIDFEAPDRETDS
ncbi:acetyl/propionyl/methylcrotonyl-CoA carboxylase subunit alpha [Pokkaliibacter sp. CJK22405]|uniref:acetyl/propionyl/methylcrotonyl-CoA carboxylase subunit alpha n=1 Tax=Pokkaliibacter sp. CJK22405 TaxID=3384615 RepID=UPI003984E5D1